MQIRLVLFFYLGYTLGISTLFSLMQAKGQDIAVIKSHDIAPFNQALEGFAAACDYPTIEYDLGGNTRRKKRILRDIMETKPKFILAIGTLAAKMAKEGIRDIPVVFFMVPNPQKYGLGSGNTTGISLDIPVEQQFNTYRSLLPNLSDIGVIYDPKKTGFLVEEAETVANKLGLTVQAYPVASEKEVPTAMRQLQGKINAFWMLPDETVVTPDSFRFLLLTTFENNIPFLATSDIFVEVGALAALSPDYTDVGRQACQLMQELARGQLSLADSHVLPPAKVNLTLNLKTASKIGLTLPSAMIQAASKVYR